MPALGFAWIVIGAPFNGFGTLVALNLVMFSVVIGALGILAEYMELNYEEVKARTHYVISRDSDNL